NLPRTRLGITSCLEGRLADRPLASRSCEETCPRCAQRSGWIDAGEAATGAMRALVRQLAAPPLAAIDPEDFFDFTQVRPVVRLSAEGQRMMRWPRSAFWTWQ